MERDFEFFPFFLWCFVYPRLWCAVSLYGVIAKKLDDNLEVSKFEQQLCYYILFWTNTL